MKLSIIIPTLNEAAGLEALLQALQPERQRGHEIIVVDGGSTDGTPHLAAPLADVVLDAPRGRARQMNAGAARAAGNVLLFLHADTWLPPNAAVVIEHALRYACWGRFDVSIASEHPWLKLVARLMNLRSRLSGIATGDQALFMRRAVFLGVGGYPEVPLMEDLALSRRLKRLGKPACLRWQVCTSGRRWESEGVWCTILLMWRLRFQYWCGTPPSILAQRYRFGAK